MSCNIIQCILNLSESKSAVLCSRLKPQRKTIQLKSLSSTVTGNFVAQL